MKNTTDFRCWCHPCCEWNCCYGEVCCQCPVKASEEQQEGEDKPDEEGLMTSTAADDKINHEEGVVTNQPLKAPPLDANWVEPWRE